MNTGFDMEFLISTAREAGKKIIEIYNREESNWEKTIKADNSPLTLADQEANDIICNRLKERFPEVPIVSEENKEIPYSERKSFSKFWLVDPLDGTKEFIKRNGEFTVNIALVENEEVVAGVVYAPVIDKMYFASKGNGAFRRDNGSDIRLETSPYSEEDKGLKIVCSRSHLNDKTQNFIDRFNSPELVSMGSSLKFMLVAEGKANIYPRLAPTMEWDTGASQIIVEEAGGNVINDETGKPLRYNKEILRNPEFIVYGKN